MRLHLCVLFVTWTARLIVADGVLNITAQPLWINYGENSTVVFSFSPSCPSMSIFRKSGGGNCYVGSTCLKNPTSSAVTVDGAGSFIRLAGQSFKANDYYYGLCTETQTVYRTLNTTNNVNLNIGVNPRILSVEVDPPDFPPFSLTRVVRPTGDTFMYNGSIDLRSGDCQIAIGVGRGYNPFPPPYGSDFTFTVPEFENSANRTFSFLEQDSQGPSKFAIGDFPDGWRYRYHFSRENLVHNRVCTIKGTASANLATTQTDVVPFEVNFSFDPIISEISVVKVNDSLTYPFAKEGDCLFICEAAACPSTKDMTYEWSFYATFMPSYTSGNVPNEPNKYLFNASDCLERYNTVLRSRLEGDYRVSCKVSLPNGISTDKQVRFFDMLNPFLSTTTTPPSIRVPQRNANSGAVQDDKLDDWKIAVIVIGCVVFVGFIIAVAIIIVKVRGRGATNKSAASGPKAMPPARMGLPPNNGQLTLTNIGTAGNVPRGQPGVNGQALGNGNQAPPPGVAPASGFAPYQQKLAPVGYAGNGAPQMQAGRSPGPIDGGKGGHYMPTGNGPYDNAVGDPKLSGSSSMGQLGYVNLSQPDMRQTSGLYDNPNHAAGSIVAPQQIYTEIAVNNTPRSRQPIQTTYAQLEQQPMQQQTQQPLMQQLPPLQMTHYSHPIFDRTMA